MRGAFKKKKSINAALQVRVEMEFGGAVKGGEKGMGRERASMCVCLCVLANLWRSWFVTINVFLMYLLNL